ncbi:hypothetical protein, partial [Oceanicella sp. SM1341]|uniref:hypothetical protein n=1 Tax=Oceanicella sp. SM1341 TaxID=1548889 RepID=UPI000E53415D
MTPQELAAQLAPVRLPGGFAAFGWQDACAVLALGLVTGLLLSPLLRLFTRARPSRRLGARAEIARLRGAPEALRLAGLAALLRRLDPEAALPAPTRRALYDPASPADP